MDNPNLPLITQEWFYLSLTEVSYSFGIEPKIVQAIVDEGIVTADWDKNKNLRFNNDAIRSIRVVVQLQKDLGINIAGAALVLDLLNEINSLKQKIGNSNEMV